MKMITSKVLLAAVCLIVVGLIIFAVAMSILGWDFSALDSSRFETSVYDINGPVQDILIVSDTDRITFVATDDGTARVELFEREKLKHRVSNEAGALKVELGIPENGTTISACSSSRLPGSRCTFPGASTRRCRSKRARET